MAGGSEERQEGGEGRRRRRGKRRVTGKRIRTSLFPSRLRGRRSTHSSTRGCRRETPGEVEAGEGEMVMVMIMMRVQCVFDTCSSFSFLLFYMY